MNSFPTSPSSVPHTPIAVLKSGVGPGEPSTHKKHSMPASHQPSPGPISKEKLCRKCLKNECTRVTSWITCGRTPWHWACVARNLLDPIDIVDEWYCAPCLSQDPRLKPTFKDPPRKSNRSTSRVNYTEPDINKRADPDRFINMTHNKKNIVDGLSASECQSIPLFPKPFRRVKGRELTMSWLVEDESAMTEPILIDDDDALRDLGMKMPSPTLTIRQISDIVGPDTPIEVIDVASQSELSRWTLDQWATYYEDPKRDKVRNVISLEVSETALGASIELPRIVRQMDWVETLWPQDLRVVGSKAYPKVQKYCLMSVARCWTDWHIDFAGSSVFYHVLRGSKTFYFIRPTLSNLEKYEKWSGDSEIQETTWLGDQVDVVYKVSLQAGHTMIIPTGWIHAVYTPVDSLVFGGNYLHSLNIPIQLRVHQIEINTKVPKKFRFPFFIQILWYVAHRYQQQLEASKSLPQACPSQPVNEATNLDSLDNIPPRILSGLLVLSNFLISQVQSTEPPSLHTGSELKKVVSKDLLDSERIPDPMQTATSLRRLVRSALGFPVEEAGQRPEGGPGGLSESSNPVSSVPKDSTGPVASDLHIKIKRKASSELLPLAHDDVTKSSGKTLVKTYTSANVDSKTNSTLDASTRPQKLIKTDPALTPITKASQPQPLSHKKDNGTIIQKVNQPATTEITHGRRIRPTIDSSGSLVENLSNQAEMQDVEIRTTSSENKVVRKSTDELGRTLYETRTVRTVIEKVYFPNDQPLDLHTNLEQPSKHDQNVKPSEEVHRSSIHQHQ